MLHAVRDCVSCTSAVSVSDMGTRSLLSRSGVAPADSRPSRPSTKRLVVRRMLEPGAPGVGDQWPQNGILYDYLLGYKFSVKDATEVSVRFPSLCCHLYES